jgi:cyanophycinase
MLRRRFIQLTAALGGAAAALPAWAGSGPGYDYCEIGDPKAPTPRPTRAGLMMLGGGDWPYEAFRWMFERAGGGRIVVLRASYGGENGEEMFGKIGGITSVQTFVIKHRRAGHDPRLLEAVSRADGIYFGGGDQSNYVRCWKGTPLNTLIDAHVREGKPVGGTSAGLAIQGAYSYGAMDGGSITSRTAMRDPYGPEVTLVCDFLHLPYLREVITDSHFAARERQGRLITFVARLIKDKGDTSITGIGIDENTALCVDEAGVGRIITGSGGSAWLIRPLRGADRLVRGRPLDFTGVPIVGVGPNSSIDLKSFEVTNPSFRLIADVKDGVLTTRPA